MSISKTLASVQANDLFKGVDFKFLNFDFSPKNFEDVKEGSIIYSSGDDSNFVYLLVNGVVKVKFSSPKKVEQKTLKMYFGDSEILDNSPRVSSAIADTDCLLYKLDKNYFQKIISDAKDLKAKLPSENEEISVTFVDPPSKQTEIKEDVNKNADETVSSDLTLDEQLENVILFSETDEIPVDQSFQIDQPIVEDSSINQDFSSEGEINFITNEDEHFFQESPLPETSEADVFNYTTTEENLNDISDLQETQLKSFDDDSEFKEALNYLTPEPFNLADAVKVETEQPQETVKSSFDNNEMLKLISEFILHDVKSPVLTIKHYSGILSRFDLSDEIKKVISLLAAQGNSILDIVQSVHDFTNKDIQLKPERINFDDLLNNVLTLLSDYVESRNVKIFKKLGADADIKIDHRKFYVACYYISKYLCDEMIKGGKIYFSSSLQENQTCLKINEEQANNVSTVISENLFDPFYIDGSNTKIGLGLAIARYIIESMNGNIKVELTETGKSFSIYLPVFNE